MKLVKQSPIKRFIGVSYNIGACNMNCSYCYLGRKQQKIENIPWSLETIKIAYSKKRLGGVCFINICGDGEPLLHPMMIDIIKTHLIEGHFVSVVTNALLSKQIKTILEFDKELLERLFFKVSFHYEELIRMNMLETQFENINLIKESPCSFTVEYITCDDTITSRAEIDSMKELCLKKIGAIPHLNMPRDERRINLGVLSKYSWDNYTNLCDSLGFDSEFYRFRKQMFGRKCKNYCYSGIRHIWIDMRTGYSYQCYNLPELQDFMGEPHRKLRCIPIGYRCVQAHCYVAYTFMTLGVVSPPISAEYRPSYFEIRNRVCSDGISWIKPTFERAFRLGVEEKEYGFVKSKYYDVINSLLRWKYRMSR